MDKGRHPHRFHLDGGGGRLRQAPPQEELASAIASADSGCVCRHHSEHRPVARAPCAGYSSGQQPTDEDAVSMAHAPCPGGPRCCAVTLGFEPGGLALGHWLLTPNPSWGKTWTHSCSSCISGGRAPRDALRLRNAPTPERVPAHPRSGSHRALGKLPLRTRHFWMSALSSR